MIDLSTSRIEALSAAANTMKQCSAARLAAPSTEGKLEPEADVPVAALRHSEAMPTIKEEAIPLRTTPTTRQLRDTPVDVKLVLCALWIAMLFVFAYVDIFGFYRADILEAALDGKVATTALTVNQVFLTSTLIYILLPTLMVVLSLLLRPRVNRIINIVVSLLYMVTIIVSCIGEEWVYYLLGSLIEVILLVAIARTAWKWPQSEARNSLV